MRYDDERKAFVGEDLVFPVKYFINETYEFDHAFALAHHGGNVLKQETRIVRGYFENRWGLSIIWGSMTYGTNHDHPWGTRLCEQGHERVYPEFVEEPALVEVAIVMPVAKVVPTQTFGPLPVTGYIAEIPEHETELWGNPLGYVTDDQLRWLCSIVAKFNSDGAPDPGDGPYIDTRDDGTYVLNIGAYEQRDGE